MFDTTQANFEVEKYRLYDNSGYDVTESVGYGLRRTDTYQPIGKASEGYKIVNYMPVINEVENALKDSGLDTDAATYSTQVYGNGAQLELIAKFSGNAVDLGQADTVIPQFVFRTSHDSTWSNNGMMGVFRTFCWNTLVSGQKLAYVNHKHTKNFNTQAFAMGVRNAGKYISGHGMDHMREWYDTRVHREQVIDMFEKTLCKKTENIRGEAKPNQVALSNLMKVFDLENLHLHGKAAYGKYEHVETGSLWSAYNAATAWSTHVAESKSDKPQNVKQVRENRVRNMLTSKHWKELENA